MVEGTSDTETLRAWLRRQVDVTLAIDLRALALMRGAFGLLVLWDVRARWGDASSLYSDAGFWTREMAGEPLFLFGFYDWAGNPDWTRLGLGVTGALALLFTVGLLTRPVTFLLWAMVTALHARQGWVLQGGDDLVRNVLFFSLFLPLGRRWSLDAGLVHRDDHPPPRRIHGWSAVALYVQLFLLYFVAGAMKAHHLHWWRGLGIHYALAADHFVTPLGRSIHGYATLLRVVGIGTLLLEFLAPFLILLGPPRRGLRVGLMVAFVSLHVGIALTLDIGLFSFVCIALWLFTLPSAWMDRIDRRRAREGPTVAASSRPMGYLAIAFMAALILTLTARNLIPKGPVRSALMRPMTGLRLQDKWSLFTGVREHTGWFVVPARTDRGAQVDLLRGGAPLSWERPREPLSRYPNQRWRKLWVTMRKDHGRRATRAYVRWLCDPASYRQVAFVYVRHAIHPPDRPMDVWFGQEERVTVHEQPCGSLPNQQ